MIRACGAMTAVLAVAVTLSGCTKTTESPVASSTAASTAASSQSAPAAVDLQSMVPTPAGTTVSKGPDSIGDNGIHLHYEVTGAPGEVMASYKKALEGKGWEVTTVEASDNGGGGSGSGSAISGSGATYTGTNGAAYGVFDGGGPSAMTYIDVCTWAAKPANPNCNRGGR